MPFAITRVVQGSSAQLWRSVVGELPVRSCAVDLNVECPDVEAP